jgi:Xaa-Pro dipeptidase
VIARVVEAMTRHDVDVMVLGREANARIVAGTMRLWLAGTRSFSPSCVAVRDPAGVHVLANSTEVVPHDFPADHLYGLTWNPDTLAGALAAIPGLGGARRTAVDGMTPGMYTLLAALMPGAEFVDAAPVLTDLTVADSPERIDGVRGAAVVAVAGLHAMADSLRPGVRARTLRGVAAEAFAKFGVTTPAFEAVAAPLDASMATWLPPERLLSEHDRIVLRAGALRDGWEASLARTYLLGHDGPQPQPPPDQWTALVERCRPGTLVGDLRSEGAVVYGVGRGVEPWDDDFALRAGMTLALEAARPDALRQDILLVTAGNPEILT